MKCDKCQGEYQGENCPNCTAEIKVKNRVLLGFRTNKLWKKSISVIYLIFLFLFIVGSLFEGKAGQITLYDFLLDKVYAMFLILFLISPYVLLSNTKFRDKLPLFKRHSKGASVIGLIAVWFVIIMVSDSIYSMHSPEYLQDMDNHAYVEVSREKSTCVEKGKINMQCQYCGETYAESLAILEHAMHETFRKEATEDAEGEVIKKCENCDKQEKIILPRTRKEENVMGEDTGESILQQSDKTNSLYSNLSDEEFKLLTEMMVESFYTLSLNEGNYKIMEKNPVVKECLAQILTYAYENNFELDPEYKKIFSTKEEVVKEIHNYKLLTERFDIGHFRDSQLNKWVYSIKSYSLNEEDIVEYNDKKFIDAEGYLQKGVEVYWIDDGQMEKVGVIKDIAYDTEIDGVSYGYALNVEYYDDPDSSGWRDGESFLTTSKKYSGKPLYYIDIKDKNRSIRKESIDYNNSTKWKSLYEVSDKKNKQVYMGTGNTKAYMFTIISVDKSSDILIVKYPSGSIETKLYSAIVNNKNLYVKK